MIYVALIFLIPLAIDLVVAAVMPLKDHKLCGGRGYDSFCHFRGKVPRFGARWVRRKVWREYR